MRAMMSLRLDKSFGSWLREFRPDFSPVETFLDRFVSYNKTNDFIGKSAVTEAKRIGPKKLQCTFIVDAVDADVVADEPIWLDDQVVGFVTSGGYSHHCQKSVAIGFVPVDIANAGQKVEIEILGRRCAAELIGEPLFDPQAQRMRG